jgi:transposase
MGLVIWLSGSDVAGFSLFHPPPFLEGEAPMTTITIPFDLPDVIILSVEEPDSNTLLITVASTILGTKCRKCGRWITQYHGTDDPRELRHLPILGRKTIVRVYPVRYRCRDCHRRPTTTQRLPWYTLRGGHTEAYDAYLVQHVINSTVQDVSQREHVGYEAVMGALRRHVATEVNWDEITDLEVLGVDEVSLKKGHKDFVTIVTGRGQGGAVRLLAILKNRKKATVKAFFQQIPARLHAQILAICTDLYEGFVNAAREVFGVDKVVADRFHVAKLYRKTLEQVRKREMRRLKATLPKAEYARLKGVMWALRKTPQALTHDEYQTLHHLFRHAPVVQTVYDLCQELTDIFDHPTSTVTEARAAMTAWVERVSHTGVRAFKTFLTTLKAHWVEITNYFLNRHNSGFVEGLNNKIKVIKRRGYGMLNPQHLFQRLSLDLSGYGGKTGK